MPGDPGGPDRTGGDADSLIAQWLDWAASDRVERASADRVRERWLRQQATEEATFAGLLVDLAEAGAHATLTTSTTVTAGRITAVGADAVAVAVRSREPSVVGVGHLVSVQAHRPRHPDATGARTPGRWSLRDVLDAYGAHRLPVRVTATDGNVWSGTVTGVGDDVVTLRTDAGPVHVSVAAVVRLDAT